jgi:site-specific recombinase XerD
MLVRLDGSAAADQPALVSDERAIELAELIEHSEQDADNATAASTRRAYANDLADFEGFCERFGTPAYPIRHEAAAAYLTALADRGYALATIVRRRAAISVEYKRRGLEERPFGHPRVVATWKGIRRRLGAAPQNAKDALLLEDHLRPIVAGLGARLIDVRDRALLLVAFAGAFRRSEVVGFDVADVRFVDHGVELHLRRSKTDQEGEGRIVGLPFGSRLETCPVRALRAWLDGAGIAAGPLFRSVTRGSNVLERRMAGQAVALVVKHRIEQAGFDPQRFAGHSLRAGFCTTGALHGLSETTIASQSGHKSMAVLRRYIRPATVWQNNAAARVGL